MLPKIAYFMYDILCKTSELVLWGLWAGLFKGGKIFDIFGDSTHGPPLPTPQFYIAITVGKDINFGSYLG